MSSPAPQRADAQANRVRLMEAARAVFSERGFHAEMKEIAERAGVGMGTIYRNFVSKDELIEAMVRDRIEIALDQLAPTKRIADPVARLRAMLEVAWARAEEDGPLIAALHGAAKEPPLEVLDELREVLELGQRAGVFRAEIDPLAFAFFIAGQFETFLLMRRVFAPGECARVLTDFVVHAVVDTSSGG